MPLTPNTATTFSLTLKVAGVPLAIPNSATVTGRFFTSDGATALSPAVPMSSTAIGADWPNGLVSVEFTATDTMNLLPPSAMIVVTVTIGASMRSWRATVGVQAADAGADRTALFVRGVILPQLRANRLVAACRFRIPAAGLTDDYLWSKLKSAEADASRRLRVYFAPTELFPETPTPDEITSLAGAPWAEDPAYDYEPDFFSADRWGLIVARQKPIIQVRWIKFAYPYPTNSVLDIPNDWIRLDKKYGHIRLVPGSVGAALPMSSLILQSLTAGRLIPHMVRVRYVAGLQNAERDFPDLLNLVQKMAVLSVLEDSFPAQSGSISADGLSRSMSFDIEKYKDGMEAQVETLRQAIHGIRMGVLG